MKVSLMITCLGDALFPEVGVATVKLLRRLGIEVDFPLAQTCCGQPHFNSGFHQDARALARQSRISGAGSGTPNAAAGMARSSGFQGCMAPVWGARAVNPSSLSGKTLSFRGCSVRQMDQA